MVEFDGGACDESDGELGAEGASLPPLELSSELKRDVKDDEDDGVAEPSSVTSDGDSDSSVGSFSFATSSTCSSLGPSSPFSSSVGAARAFGERPLIQRG